MRRPKPQPLTATLKLPGSVYAMAEADDLHGDLATMLLAAAVSAVDQRGVFHLALSGGSTPEPFFRLLVIDPRFRELPWDQTHVWQVDERCVADDDERRNWRMLREMLLDHVPTRQRLLHPMPVLADDAATQYEDELREIVGSAHPSAIRHPPSAIPTMDFILLGMGDDGHTASLFPQSPALSVRNRLVTANDGPHVTPPPRLTMTYALLNAARRIMVLVTGAGKHVRLRQVAAAAEDGASDAYVTQPILGVQPTVGQLGWCLDGPAAGLSAS